MKESLGKIIFLLLCFFSTTIFVNAECSYEEQVKLSAEASNVRVVYEIIENTTEEELKNYLYPINDYIQITVYNVTENVTVTITDDTMGGEDALFLPVSETIAYEDTKSGTYTFNVDIMNQVRTLYVAVSSQSENCSLKQESRQEMRLPYFNVYSTFDGCENNSEYYCQKYSGVDINMDRDQVMDEISKPQVKPEDPPSLEEQEINIWWYAMVIGGGVVIVVLLIAIIVTLYRIKQRRSVL